MKNEKRAGGGSKKPIVSLEDFKSIFGVDERDEKTAFFCLSSASCAIEQYCKRKFLRERHFERFEFAGGLTFALGEYPVISMSNEKLAMSNGETIEPEFYRIVPDCGSDIEIPYSLILSPALLRFKRLSAIQVVYRAGYKLSEIPADLAAACFELAAWNFNRYKSGKIGMAGGARGNGRGGEDFEIAMPENVKALLEPYKRKMI